MKIYHNPRCSKSRQALAMLQEAGSEVEIFEYLKTPPTPDELADVISKLGITSEQLVRKKEALFKELGLHKRTLTEEQWIQVLCKNPKLIERPIVISGNRAVVGRPPELIRTLF